MNSAITDAKTRATVSKRPAPSDPFTTSMQIDAAKKIFFSDNLRHRWERIVSGDRA